MTICRVRYADHNRGWSLNETCFADFNLLVGKSGVGKTHVLNSLRVIRNAGVSSKRSCPNGCEWEIELEANGINYVWTATTSKVSGAPNIRVTFGVEDDDDDHEEEVNGSNPVFESERLMQVGTQPPLVERNADQFLFNGTKLPKLKNDTSAVSLLRDEKTIEPVYSALRRILSSEAPAGPRVLSFIPYDKERIEAIQRRSQTLDGLREITTVPVLIKGYLLQQGYHEDFARIRQAYSSIFPTVTDICIGPRSEFEPDVDNELPFRLLSIAIKEDGVEGWIVGERLSSGMFRTLVHLIELALAPAGTVLVIDELENSLGVNCLDEIVQTLLDRCNDIQVIATSHHPYVINAVPLEKYRLVTRKGSIITVKDVRNLAGMKGRSAQDNFIRLINLAEYEDGIQ